MRTLTGNLPTEQVKTSYTPYIEFKLTSSLAGATEYDYSSRVLQIEHNEEVYNEYATVYLDNSDLGVNTALRGCWTQIGYGYTISGTPEVLYTPRLWVKKQISVSKEGRLVTMLYLEGAWAMMSEILLHIGDPPYYDGSESTKTVYELLEDLIEVKLATDTGLAFTLEPLGAQDDSIINSFIPIMKYNQNQAFESMNYVIQSLMAMTKCWLITQSDLKFKVVFPQTTDTVNQTYYSYQAHYFFEHNVVDTVLLPNHYVVYANQNEDGTWTNLITAEAEDTTAEDEYTEITAYHVAPSIDNQVDANNRASALLEKARMARLLDRLIVPHDISVELLDKVVVDDTRGT
jgi:hypothetical protein